MSFLLYQPRLVTSPLHGIDEALFQRQWEFSTFDRLVSLTNCTAVWLAGTNDLSFGPHERGFGRSRLERWISWDSRGDRRCDEDRSTSKWEDGWYRERQRMAQRNYETIRVITRLIYERTIQRTSVQDFFPSMKFSMYLSIEKIQMKIKIVEVL